MSVLEQITSEVETDPVSVGLILHGSRAAGTDRESRRSDRMGPLEAALNRILGRFVRDLLEGRLFQ